MSMRKNNVIYSQSEALEKDKTALFRNTFLLFMLGNVLGVILEGMFCLILRGKWETHVTFLWGYFNIVYGAGLAFIYLAALKLQKRNIFINFFAFALLGTAVEWLAGIIQEKLLRSVSWEYGKLALGRYICVPFTLAWGILGIVFVKIILPGIERLFSKIKNEGWTKLCFILAAAMAVNFIFSMAVLARWGERSVFPEPGNFIEEFIDKHYPSDYLQSRFVEWKMLN